LGLAGHRWSGGRHYGAQRTRRSTGWRDGQPQSGVDLPAVAGNRDHCEITVNGIRCPLLAIGFRQESLCSEVLLPILGRDQGAAECQGSDLVPLPCVLEQVFVIGCRPWASVPGRTRSSGFLRRHFPDSVQSDGPYMCAKYILSALGASNAGGKHWLAHEQMRRNSLHEHVPRYFSCAWQLSEQHR